VRVARALYGYETATGRFPDSEGELRTALVASGIDPSTLHDPWDRPYVAAFSKFTANRATTKTVVRVEEGRLSTPRLEAILVERTVGSVTLFSSGPDGQPSTHDDFMAATFSGGREQPIAPPPPVAPVPSFPGATGAIAGVVTDPNGAVVEGVVVRATHDELGFVAETITSDDGAYLLTGLPSGTYTVVFEARGFQTMHIQSLPLVGRNLLQLSPGLTLGTVSEAVAVVAADESVQTSSSQVSTVETISTPRLREYFPETLLWEPSLETGPDGRARLAFKLADSITTWRLSVVASTADGRIGVAERDLRAFQPFFVEHDPPRVLTVGDEIALPVVLRNYLDGPQRVDVSMQPADWFTMLGPDKTRADVASGEPSRQFFKFRAVSAVDDGKQRVTALGRRASDAVEKPVDVHPDGQEMSATAGQVLGESGTLAIDVPGHAIPGSLKAEIKLYPNLIAHVVEGVEAVMQRPYGCGEQTISSTYPSLLVLRAYERMGRSDAAVAEKARRYLELGYKRLLGYRSYDGGFSYWGDGSPDVALTAYALRFLSNARAVTKVDDAVIEGARRWLLQKQRADGGWSRYESTSDRMLTAYVAAALAATAPASDAGAVDREAIKRALALEKGTGDPYALAAYLLSTTPADAAVAARLAALAKDGGYWESGDGTPFHGWGRAGQVETTALAIRALLHAGGHDDLVRRATYFLVRNKDRYGVWYSTQATVAALDALDAVSYAAAAAAGGASRLEVSVNGRAVTSVLLSDRATGPVLVDLSPHVAPGRIDVEVRGGSGAALAAQLVARWYVPWEHKAADSDALSFDVRYDKTETAAGETITCRVDAGRTEKGRGYGMLLAEIGLPPGAEVDRESLQRAMATEGWSLDRFDVLPDRVIAYVWPYDAKPAHFEFTFRVRYGIAAQTAPSVLYDYYNPDARRAVLPVHFRVAGSR
jgi:uncharacterized protein YfaS (alpha-2-macroglobulin family)